MQLKLYSNPILVLLKSSNSQLLLLLLPNVNQEKLPRESSWWRTHASK
jgi:hypothetical protein